MVLPVHEERLPLFVDHVTTYHAERAKSIGADALPDFVRSGIALAQKYELFDTRDVCRLLDLVMYTGADWTTEDNAWMHARMTDPSLGDLPRRLERVRREMMYRMEEW